MNKIYLILLTVSMISLNASEHNHNKNIRLSLEALSKHNEQQGNGRLYRTRRSWSSLAMMPEMIDEHLYSKQVNSDSDSYDGDDEHSSVKMQLSSKKSFWIQRWQSFSIFLWLRKRLNNDKSA